jgi:Holliday junction resolvasome RuvABC endonuclease subunit
MSQLILDISEVCDILDKEIKPNTVSLGIDQAELNTGLCLIRTTKDKFYVETFYGIELKSKPKTQMHNQLSEYYKKAIDIKNDLPKYAEYNKVVIIEDCFMGFNPWTTKVLAKFSAISYLVFKNWADNIPIPISPISVRCKVGFKKDSKSKIKLKEQIKNWIEDKFDLIIDNDNLADGFILALQGVIEDV